MEEDEILETVENFLDGQRLYDTKTGETIKPYSYSGGQRFVWGNEYVAIQGLLDLYCKEKKKNKKIENKLKYDINKLNEKIKEKASLYGERYNKTRLKGIRTKCKEILRFMEEI